MLRLKQLLLKIRRNSPPVPPRPIHVKCELLFENIMQKEHLLLIKKSSSAF